MLLHDYYFDLVAVAVAAVVDARQIVDDVKHTMVHQLENSRCAFVCISKYGNRPPSKKLDIIDVVKMIKIVSLERSCQNLSNGKVSSKSMNWKSRYKPRKTD